jgi:hypothetical protein
VRGTVQADILKEDQAQNTCIFSTEFSLKLMGDVQEYFSQNAIENFYSVSISGYHIAEAGANPISQLAFTLANGFTYCEYYLKRGLAIDAFAPNFSFFFSNGLDPEYAVIGRVARRIWAIALRERYGAAERSQKLKYHIQTSGRSLHAQEMSFNDIRTTLQALLALQDACNSLHTNAYDEAVTTPTEESVRRALAIQLILNREFGWLKNENPAQGSYYLDALTDAVETRCSRSRAHPPAAACSGDGDHVTRPDSRREHALRVTEALGELPIIEEHLPRARRIARRCGARADPLVGGREAGVSREPARLPRAQRRARARGAGALARGRSERRERLRGAAGDREGGEPGPDLGGAVRGRGTLPPQDVNPPRPR